MRNGKNAMREQNPRSRAQGLFPLMGIRHLKDLTDFPCIFNPLK